MPQHEFKAVFAWKLDLGNCENSDLYLYSPVLESKPTEAKTIIGSNNTQSIKACKKKRLFPILLPLLIELFMFDHLHTYGTPHKKETVSTHAMPEMDLEPLLAL